jgi:hypothetical protein
MYVIPVSDCKIDISFACGLCGFIAVSLGLHIHLYHISPQNQRGVSRVSGSDFVGAPDIVRRPDFPVSQSASRFHPIPDLARQSEI